MAHGAQMSPGLKRLTTQAHKAVRISKLAVDIAYATATKKDGLKRHIGRISFDALKGLGPTFVKIGQFLSTRSDIFGKDFTDELKGLQDNVSPMAAEEVAPLLEGLSATGRFQAVEPAPIASASIGQVHVGTLNDGTQVAIKLKRQGINQTIEDDFTMLLGVIETIKLFASHRQITEIEISLKEYYGLLKEEIDFEKEVANMKQFKEQFKRTQWIKVPTPYEALCSNDTIVMEYVPSVKISDIPEIDRMRFSRRLLSEKLLECFFTQIVTHGFVHIDPHPGNVGVTPAGKVVFYDYGMFVRLDGVMKTSLKNLFLAMYDRDVDEVCRLLVDLKIVLVEPSKLPYFRRFIASFLTYLDNLDINDFKVSYLDRIDQSQMQFQIASKFILLLRGITILEGICKALNTNFSYREVLDPFINEFVIDVDYLERRGTRDLARLTGATSKIAASEISIGMVETDMEAIKSSVARTSTQSRYMLLAALGAVLTQAETLEARAALGAALLYTMFAR